MAKLSLVSALDFKKDKRVPNRVESKLIDGVWYVYKSGPGYANTYRVEEHDSDEEKWLKDHEVRE